MKLVIAVVQNKDAGRLLERLVQNGFGATRLASTGGFLREGNTTIITAVEAARLEGLLDIIRELCRSRQQLVTPVPGVGPADAVIPYPVEVTVGGATVFVLNIERYEKV